MEQNKNYRAIFRQKKDDVHSPEEICLAFDTSFSACFTLTEDRTPGARMQLFGKIWDINPDAIIAEADLFVVQSDPVAAKDQYLVISKNGTRESNALLAQCLEESGVITSPWYIRSQKQGCIKTCYRYVSGSDKPAVLHKANLLIDGDDLLLSVRHLTGSDHTQIKAAQEK